MQYLGCNLLLILQCQHQPGMLKCLRVKALPLVGLNAVQNALKHHCTPVKKGIDPTASALRGVKETARTLLATHILALYSM